VRWLFLILFTTLFTANGAAPVLQFGQANAQDRTERISFADGRSARTVRDVITGYEGIDYLVGVSAGQRLAATLRTDNPSSYLNTKARGSSEALFDGSVGGNLGDVIAPSSGDYVVEVYLMRNAARRGESAAFSLTVEVTGGAPRQRQPDFADGLSGGPDFWEVANVPPGDRLNIRSRPSSQATTVARLRNGAVLRNLGCRMNGQTRWCRVERRDGSARGWAAGRFLVESGGW
jgi:hypothetical protein